MKNFKFLLLSACIALAACTTQKQPEQQISDKGTKWNWDKGTIVVETPERPAGQTSALGLALPKMEVVRIGFVGLGMRGPGAVERFTYIPVWRSWLCATMKKRGRKDAKSICKTLPCRKLPYMQARRGMKNYASATISTWFTLPLIGCITSLWRCVH